VDSKSCGQVNKVKVKKYTGSRFSKSYQWDNVNPELNEEYMHKLHKKYCRRYNYNPTSDSWKLYENPNTSLAGA